MKIQIDNSLRCHFEDKSNHNQITHVLTIYFGVGNDSIEIHLDDLELEQLRDELK